LYSQSISYQGGSRRLCNKSGVADSLFTCQKHSFSSQYECGKPGPRADRRCLMAPRRWWWRMTVEKVVLWRWSCPSSNLRRWSVESDDGHLSSVAVSQLQRKASNLVNMVRQLHSMSSDMSLAQHHCVAAQTSTALTATEGSQNAG
jgi:hypothetical protein